MSLKILFIEDSAADAELAAVELKRAGIELVARRVETEGDFIRELHEFKPDIILSDFSMPQFAGYQALALAQIESLDTPFIFLSGTIGEETAIESLKRGATDYVLKNRLMRLAPAVRRAIEEAEARSARQAAEARLHESEQRYRELFQSNPHSMWVYDIATLRFLAVNDAAVSRYGFAREEFLRMTLRDIRFAADVPELLELVSNPIPTVNRPRTWRHRIKSGESIDVEVASHGLLFEGRSARMVVAYDITERKQHEDRIARLSQIHAVLSGISSAIVRIRVPKELYQEACRIAVEQGGLRMAWIGLVKKSTLNVEPVAWAGYESGFLNTVARLSIEENTSAGQDAVGRAIRSRLPVVTNDFATDPQIQFKEENLARGYRAGVVMPLMVGDEAVGLLSLYASETGFFDDEEVKLLTELAANIAFSMEHIQQEERLRYLAYYDALTGLANRSLLQDRLLQALHFADRFRLTVTVLVINLDRFKFVNDTLGHLAGDDVLKVAGGRIVACVRDIDTVARFGGDEFVVVLSGTKDDGDSAQPIAQRIVEAFLEPMVYAGRELFVTCSVGVASYPRDAQEEDGLLRNAAAAMSRAKDHGRNSVQFYTPETNARAEERLSLESALRRALERDEFLLHYQPQVDLRTGQIVGLEALIRWERGDLGLIPPASFIPIAEETGLILPIGEWVLRTAVQQNKAWQSEGLPQMRIAVNLSAQQFRQQDLPRRIQRILADTGLEPKYLEVELTESMLMREIESAVGMMSELRRVGVRISLDDFGIGYSSLSYLKRFPIDTLKIDQSFVREITSDSDSAAIANAIIAMAHGLRLTVLAEGVETEGQLAFLRAHNCDQMQGFLFSKPLPASELAQVLRERRSLPVSSPVDESATILLLDDEPSILSALRRLLRGEGYKILFADTPAAAFELLAQNRVQIIISDQRMPAMSGTEFFGRVKALYPDTIRIMLSGYSELSAVTEAINQGAVYKFLSKPWDDDELRAVIKEALRRFTSQMQ